MHGPFDLRIEEVELPALREDQVLIKLLACGICQSDVECFEGKSAEGCYDLGPYTHVIPEDWNGEIGIFVENFTVDYWGVWGESHARCESGENPS